MKMNFKEILFRNKVILFSMLTLWLSLDYIILGPFSYIRAHDVFEGPVVNHALWASNFLKYGETLWIPNIAGGVDSAAAASGVMRAMFSIFPVIIGYQIIMVLLSFFAGYGAYLVSKNHFKLSEFSSLFCGGLFAIQVIDYVPGNFGIAIFPIILILLDKCLQAASQKKPAFLYVIPVAILYSFSTLITILPFTWLLIILWFLFIKNEYRFKTLFWTLLLFSVTSFLWQFQEIYALIANKNFSNRSAYGHSPMSFMNFEDAFQIKDAFAVSLTFLSIFLSALKNKRFNVILVFIVLCGLVPGLVNWLRMYLDIHFMKGLGEKAFLNLHFLFAICAAHTFDYTQNYTKHNFRYVFRVTCVTLIFLLSVQIKYYHASGWWGMRYGSAFENENLKKLSLQLQDELFRVTTISIKRLKTNMIPSYAALYGLEIVGGHIAIYPIRYRRFFAKIKEPILEEQGRKETFLSERGPRLSLDSPEWSRVWSGHGNTINFSQYYNLNLLSLANTKYIISKLKIADKDLLPVVTPYLSWLDSHNCSKRWYKCSSVGVLQKIKDRFSALQDFYIYENKKVLPRFFIASGYRAFSNHTDLLNEMAKSDASDFKKTVLIEKGDEMNFKFQNAIVSKYKIKLTEYRPHKIVLEMELDGDGILVISNSYNPFWKVKINEETKQIFPVNHAFWGVPVSKEDKRVVFYYDPPYSYKNILKTNF